MERIKEIIKSIDDKLIETEKEYLSLAQANKILVQNKIISVAENSNKYLKKLLEEQKIPHAYQTQQKPKQWRIPLSDEGKEIKKTVKKKNQKRSTNKDSNKINARITLTKTQRNWLIVIAIIFGLWLIGTMSEDSSSSKNYSNSEYTVNTTTYVATSKSSFDEMFRYINDGDNQALSTLMSYGEVQTLSAGTKVNLVSPHFSYCVVRLQGSTRNLWIVTDHITKN